MEVRTTSWASVSLTRGSSTGPGLVTVGVEVRPRPRVREVRDNVVILMPDLHAQTGEIGTLHFIICIVNRMVLHNLRGVRMSYVKISPF